MRTRSSRFEMTVTGTLRDVDGGAAGLVIFRRTEMGVIDGVFYAPGERRLTTAGDGSFSIALTPGWWEMLWLEAKCNLVVESGEGTANFAELMTSISFAGANTAAGGSNMTSVLNRAALKALPDHTPLQTVLLREPEEAGLATIYYKTVDDETEADEISIIASDGGGLRWVAKI